MKPLFRFIAFLVIWAFNQNLLAQSGTLDVHFMPSTEINNLVSDIQIQADGKILLFGYFTKYNGKRRFGMARLDINGALDLGFNTGTGANDKVHSGLALPSGNIVLAGSFTKYNGVTCNRIAQVLPNSDLDPSFNAGSGANHTIWALAAQTDGKLLIGGSFTTIQGISKSYLARLHPNGNLDHTFNVGNSGPNNSVKSIKVLSNGQILVAGDFQSYNAVPKKYIARLNADGSLDTSFNSASGPNAGITEVDVLPNGHVYVVGVFTQVDGQSRNRIARLLPNGQIDTLFNPGAGFGSAFTLSLNAVLSLQNGKVLVGGSFDTYNGILAKGLLRLHSNGMLDTSFNSGNTGLQGGKIWALKMQLDSNLLMGGEFWNYNGNTIHNIARLLNGSYAPLPNLTQTSVNHILPHSAFAQSRANIQGGYVLARGFCWSKAPQPTTLNNYVFLGNDTGYFAVNMGNLQGNTHYHLRAFATNSTGTAYSQELEFDTPCASHSLSAAPNPNKPYSVSFNWMPILGASHRLQWRNLSPLTGWNGVNTFAQQRTIQNLPPGNYEARVYGIGLGDTSCPIPFTVACDTSIGYAFNLFQSAYLNALPASSARVTIFNVSGGKSLYNFELENLSSGSISRVEGRRNYTFNQLAGGNYVVRVYDAYNCSASVETPVVIEALDTAYIPNLISAVNSSPNGFRPLWNRPRQNGQLSPGVLSYQLRVRNETDNQLVNLYTGIADTFFNVNNLTPGKLYRFNVRSRYNPGGGARNSAFSIRRDRSLGAGGNKLEEGAEEPQEGVRVYPNPTHNVVNAESPIGSRIKLYDLQGRLLQSHLAEGHITQIDLSLYAVGTYVLKVETPNKVEQFKVVKQ